MDAPRELLERLGALTDELRLEEGALTLLERLGALEERELMPLERLGALEDEEPTLGRLPPMLRGVTELLPRDGALRGAA